MSSNPSLTKGGLPIASQGHAVLGLAVRVIGTVGEICTGLLEEYYTETDDFDVIYADRGVSVTARTNQSASGRSGDFGGNLIQEVVWQRSRMVYIDWPGVGKPRFILSGQDDQILLDWDAANRAALKQPSADQTETSQPAGSQDTNAPAGSPPPAPEVVGKETPPEHPDIAPGVVEEPETPVIPAEEQKGKLPKDFPGRAALENFGITKFGQLKKLKNLQDVPGIGDATAAKIKAAIGG